MSPLSRLNELPWYVRLPIKCALFGFTVLAVCFPYPNRFLRHVERWTNPNELIEPDAPSIQPLVQELRANLTPDLAPKQALAYVERFVYERVPYEWDWNTWGTSDYLPTVAEVMEMGKEDCDGRAVLAASLLRNFGFQTELVTDWAHMWVKTDQGETMSPGTTRAIIATERGPRLNPRALLHLPSAFAFGLAVFPLRRELIAVAMLWILLLRPKSAWTANVVGLAALVGGLLLVRAGSTTYLKPSILLQLMGLVTFVVGALAVVLLGKWMGQSRAGRAAKSRSPGQVL